MVPWKQDPWLVVDTETTGTDPTADRIVEVAWALMERGEKKTGFSTLINPGVPIPQAATAVNGITDEMVAHAPTFGAIYDDVLDAVIDAPVLVAYNWCFDAAFLAAHVGEQIWLETTRGKAIIDPLVAVRLDGVGRFWRGKGRHKLEAVVARLGLPGIDRAHRAAGDAEAAGRVLWALRHHLPDDGAEAAALIERERKRQDADFAAWRARQQQAGASQ